MKMKTILIASVFTAIVIAIVGYFAYVLGSILEYDGEL